MYESRCSIFWWKLNSRGDWTLYPGLPTSIGVGELKIVTNVFAVYLYYNPRLGSEDVEETQIEPSRWAFSETSNHAEDESSY